MHTFTITATTLSFMMLASGSALAFSEGSVNKADIARATAEVGRVADRAVRAEAQNLVNRAQDQLQDGEKGQAFFSLRQALDLAAQDHQMASR